MGNFIDITMRPDGIDNVIQKLTSRDSTLAENISELSNLLKKDSPDLEIYYAIEKLARRIHFQLDFKKFNPERDKDGKTSLTEQIADWDNKGGRDCKLATVTLAMILDSLCLPLSISFYNGGAHPYLIFRLADSVFSVSYREEDVIFHNTNTILDPWNGVCRGLHEVYPLDEGLVEMENRFLFVRKRWEEA